MSEEFDAPAQQSSNVMGIVGFVLAILGVLSGGCFSIVALPFCIIGLNREPRAFAIAGLVISLLSLAGWISLILLGGVLLVGLLAAIGIGIAVVLSMLDPNIVEAFDDLAEYRAANGSFPAALADLPTDAAINDRHGQPFEYALTPGGYTLRTIGEDGQPGTDDDILVTVTVQPDGDFNVQVEGPGDLDVNMDVPDEPFGSPGAGNP